MQVSFTDEGMHVCMYVCVCVCVAALVCNVIYIIAHVQYSVVFMCAWVVCSAACLIRFI